MGGASIHICHISEYGQYQPAPDLSLTPQPQDGQFQPPGAAAVAQTAAQQAAFGK